MGCGAPVIPVVGLAFVGLSSGALALLAVVSRVATALVLLALAVGVAWLGWLVGGPPRHRGPRDQRRRRAPRDRALLISTGERLLPRRQCIFAGMIDGPLWSAGRISKRTWTMGASVLF